MADNNAKFTLLCKDHVPIDGRVRRAQRQRYVTKNIQTRARICFSSTREHTSCWQLEIKLNLRLHLSAGMRKLDLRLGWVWRAAARRPPQPTSTARHVRAPAHRPQITSAAGPIRLMAPGQMCQRSSPARAKTTNTGPAAGLLAAPGPPSG